MSGSYSPSPRFRVTSLVAGAATVYDPSAYTWTTRATVKDAPVFTSHEMLDYSIEQTRYGTRRQYLLDFEFATDSGSTANEAELMTVLGAALSDDNMIEISLDGGANYREVQLESFNIDDMDGKKIGRVASTVWTVKALMTGPLAVLAGGAA